jgi:hypothetical protein
LFKRQVTTQSTGCSSFIDVLQVHSTSNSKTTAADLLSIQKYTKDTIQRICIVFSAACPNNEKWCCVDINVQVLAIWHPAETATELSVGTLAATAAAAAPLLLLLLLHLPRMCKDSHAHVPMQTTLPLASYDTTSQHTQLHCEH